MQYKFLLKQKKKKPNTCSPNAIRVESADGLGLHRKLELMANWAVHAIITLRLPVQYMSPIKPSGCYYYRYKINAPRCWVIGITLEYTFSGLIFNVPLLIYLGYLCVARVLGVLSYWVNTMEDLGYQ